MQTLLQPSQHAISHPQQYLAMVVRHALDHPHVHSSHNAPAEEHEALSVILLTIECPSPEKAIVWLNEVDRQPVCDPTPHHSTHRLACPCHLQLHQLPKLLHSFVIYAIILQAAERRCSNEWYTGLMHAVVTGIHSAEGDAR